MAFFDGGIGVLFKIRGDASQARAELGGFRGAVQSELQSITSSFTATTGTAGRLAGAFGPVGIGAAVVGGAALAAAGSIFTLAKNAADAGSRIYDLSRNTGVSATILSSLKVAADQSGASIESVAGGISKFNRLIGEANEGSKKATATLTRFGIDPQDALRNSEAALGKVVSRINALPPGIERANAARAAFGKGGDQLVSTLEAVGGNLDEFIEKARRLGVVIDDEAARQADEFGDQLDTLSTQISGVAQTIGRGLLPEITRALNDISAALSQNQGDFNDWARTIARAAAAVRASFEEIGTLAREEFGGGKPITDEERTAVVTKLQKEGFSVAGDVSGLVYKARAEAARAASLKASAAAVDASFMESLKERESRSGRASTPSGGGAGGGSGRGGRARDDARQAALESLKVQQREEDLAYKQQTTAIKREYDQRLTSLDDYTNKALAIEQKHFEAIRDNLLKERRTVEASKRADVDQKLAEAQFESEQSAQKIREEAAQRRLKVVEETNQRLLELGGIHDREALARIEDNSEQQLISFEKAERARQAIESAALTRRREALDREFAATKDIAAEREGIQAKINKLEAEAVAFREEASRRIGAALRKDLENERNFTRDLQSLRQANLSQALDVAAGRVAVLVRQGANRRLIIAAEEGHALQTERLRHERALASIDAEQKEAERSLAVLKESEEKKAAVRREFATRRELEESRFVDANAEIRNTSKEKRATGDSGNKLLDFFGKGIDITVRDANKEIIEGATGTQQAMAGVQAALLETQKIGSAAFKSLAEGSGQMLQNWVLLGEAGPHAFRKMTAQILASLAAQAAVESVMELARGLAALANPVTAFQAPGHFAASAVFASVAGVAAIAGRKVAGDLFKADARGASGAPNQSRLAAEDRPQPRTIIETRPQPVRQQEHTITIRTDENKIVAVVKANIDRDGELRTAVRETAAAFA